MGGGVEWRVISIVFVVSFSISDTLKSLGGAWNTGMIRGKPVSVVMT